MKVLLIRLILSMITVLISCDFDDKEKGHFLPHVVSSEWLSDNLDNPQLVVLHVGRKKDFEKEHIPGSHWVDFSSIQVRNESQGVSSEMPDINDLNTVFNGWGIRDSSIIVLYFGTDWIAATTRLYFAFDYAGLGDQTYILDGGLNVWKNEKYPLSSETGKTKIGNLSLKAPKPIIVKKAWLVENLESDKFTLIDVRSTPYYLGKKIVKNWETRPGHIPGAINIPHHLLVDDSLYCFKDHLTLEDIFIERGAVKDKEIITYCHVGQYASQVYFIAKNLGYKTRLYDGSFEEWGKEVNLPLSVKNKNRSTVRFRNKS